jgi:hypothetical protein
VGPANTIANLNNGAYMVEYDGWIYYANPNDKNQLYKMKPDGTKSKQLVSSSVKNLCIANGFIYFIDTDRYNVIYRCNTNGNRIKKVVSNSCTDFNISGKYIYYSNLNKDDKLYRCNLNGSHEVKVNNIKKLSTACIVDNVLYSPYFERNNTIHKIDLITGKVQKLNETISWNCTVIDNFLFFIDSSDSYTLYRMNLDGTNLLKISSPNCTSYNIINDTLFYQSEEPNKEGLYSSDLNGTKTTLIYSGYFNRLNSISSSLYYINFDAQKILLKYDLSY